MFAQCMDTKREVAIKVASTADCEELRKEYALLQRLDGLKGFPAVFYYGQQELLGSGTR